jgi:hypothetical protein
LIKKRPPERAAFLFHFEPLSERRRSLNQRHARSIFGTFFANIGSLFSNFSVLLLNPALTLRNFGPFLRSLALLLYKYGIKLSGFEVILCNFKVLLSNFPHFFASSAGRFSCKSPLIDRAILFVLSYFATLPTTEKAARMFSDSLDLLHRSRHLSVKLTKISRLASLRIRPCLMHRAFRRRALARLLTDDHRDL